MPKILINEIDKTSAGDPGSYSNYTVLVAGFTGVADAAKGNIVEPDSNGVYEFSSAGDFEATIGLDDPKHKCNYEYTDTEHTVIVQHYGNQMAYELLKLGYPIIYLPINRDAGVRVLENESTWEIFKDKVSYDFRFITHGLLNSHISTDAKDLEGRINELTNAKNSIDNELDAELTELAISNLDELVSKLVSDEIDTEGITALELAYQEKIFKATPVIPGTVNPKTGIPYTTLIHALLGSNAETDTSNDDKGAPGIIAELTAKQALFDKRVVSGAKTEPVLDENGEAVLDEDGNPEMITTDTGTISKVNANIANLAKYIADSPTGIPGRGDCIALIELDENAYANAVINPELNIITAINQLSDINADNGKYCAMTVPSVIYTNGIKMPGAFHYLACFINSLQLGFAEWYAAAGYTRGVASYRIDRTAVTLGEIAINALEPRNTDGSKSSPKFACNVIANFRGSYYLWGNRTAHPLGDAKSTDGDLKASHFLNIRQLCTTIKKQLFVACRRFTFDPNSDTLWFNFVNAIRPTLEAMKADQGIRDYKILKVVETKPKKATLKAKIRIIPIEAVEDFDIEVSLEDSFGETSVTTAD